MSPEADIPTTRRRLLPGIEGHLEELGRSFDRIGEDHRAAGQKLVGWIVDNYRPSRPLPIIVVCTGNSRRSILGATMGNVTAASCDLPGIRFHSGGTDPTAFNPRTVAALRQIGVEVEPTGPEAPRGEPDTANPFYLIRWGSPGEPAMEAIEFSKRYDDPSNPQSGFAALMVCDEADAGCPAVRGAVLRLLLPFTDPKMYDDAPEESARYAERRDDIGRVLLWVMRQARDRLALRVTTI
jgi:arsenate reductase (thioredoxin)